MLFLRLDSKTAGRSRVAAKFAVAAFVAAFVAFTVCSRAPAFAADPPAPPSPGFNREIRPLLADRCFRCHGPDSAARKAGLRLDRRDGATSDLPSGKRAIVPGDVSASELVRRITATDPSDRMPPPDSKLALSEEERDLLIEWVRAGAPYLEHWSFEPIQRPSLPAVDPRHAEWVRNSIDRFVLVRLERDGLEPSPPASPYTLVRRVSLDLTGLPPPVDEAERFLRDSSSLDVGAYERLVDRLLASPAYGERMAAEWLDVARYADSNGYQGDAERTMWPWRDWVVSAFRENLPYDDFTVWQLAGDLLPDATFEQRLATGFNRNHPINGEGGRIPEENRVDYVMDMAETTGTAWLGLTLQCSRCHDHKFDPLTRRDYYAFFAFFNKTPVDGGGGNPQTPPVLRAPTPAESQALEDIERHRRELAHEITAAERQLAAAAGGRAAEPLPEDVTALLGKDPLARKRDELALLEKHFESRDAEYARRLRELRETAERREAVERSIPRVMVMADRAETRKTYLLDKGLYDRRGDEVTADVPASLPPLPESAARNRLGLARWLVSPENPLTARVTVNRVWQQLWGTGLVKTPEDFGTQGEPPSHPDLLDYLAWEFRESGWDLKSLVRLIVTSATYRQSSSATPELLGRDPENRLLARGARFRMSSLMIRDQALATSGLLVDRIGGPPVYPYQPAGVWAEATFGNKRYPEDHGANLYRRSIYTFWRRIVGPTVFFDSASREKCTVRDVRTNTPLHALTTLNDVTFVEAARVLAEDIASELAERTDGAAGEIEPRRLIARAFRRVLVRPPSETELDVLVRGFEDYRRELEGDLESARALLSVGESPPLREKVDGAELARVAALAVVCNVLLNLDEALTKE